MKKLIQNNIAKDYISKTIRCIDNFQENDLNQRDKPKKDQFSQYKIEVSYLDKTDNNQAMKLVQKDKNVWKPGCKQLKSKFNAQQVSCLYSQHIYKSMQRDYIHEAQLQKYKQLLESQKKQKLQLLAEQSIWKIEKAKLMEQKQLILFALDSLTVKLDTQSHTKRNKEIRRQTVQLLKNKLNQNEQSRFKFDQNKPSDGNQNQFSCSQQSSKQLQNNLGTSDKQLKLGYNNWQKIKAIQSLKLRLNANNSQQISNIVSSYQQTEAKMVELDKENKVLKPKVQKLEIAIKELQNNLIIKDNTIDSQSHKIQDLKAQTIQLNLKIQKAIQKQQILKCQNVSLQKEIQSINSINQQLKGNINNLQLQLRLTQDQYKQRQQKEKHCVRILQKFSKQLKLSDQKIKQFLDTEVLNYNSQDIKDLACVKKTYNQHLSYILHLCKKKQAVYQNLLEQLREKIKQDDFRTSIIEKKLNNFIKFQQNLRSLVLADSDKATVFRTIMKFGHS